MLGGLRTSFNWDEGAEWTVEANPETVTPEIAATLRAAGVTRVSMGAQSFQPRLLQALERHHDPASVVRAVQHLRAAGVLCAVISNDDMAGIEHFLASHQLGAFFSGLWSAEHRPRKPDPAAVHGLCDQLGVRASRCALIGDANSDLRMAVAAGIPHQLALGYTAAWSSPPPLAEPHPLIHSWSELSLSGP